MNEKSEIKLAIKNGRKEAYRKQKTAKEISEIYVLSKEVGLLGDAVEYLFELVSQLHEGVTIDPAFRDWRNKVADIKQSITEEISKIQKEIDG